MTTGGGNPLKSSFPTFSIFHMDGKTHLYLLSPLHLLGNLSSAQRTEDTSEFTSLLLPLNNVYLSYWIPEKRTKKMLVSGKGVFSLLKASIEFLFTRDNKV